MAFITPQDQIASLYVGYLGRSPDAAGLAYWVSRLNAGMSLSQIAQSFAGQPETTSRYSFLANPTPDGVAGFLGAVVQSLFNRAIDAAGLAYWTSQINGGRPVGPAILDIILGAQGNDLLVLTDKVEHGVTPTPAPTPTPTPTPTSVGLASPP